MSEQTADLIGFIIENDDRKSHRLEVPAAGVNVTLRQPIYACARYLIRQGWSPETRIILKRRKRDGGITQVTNLCSLGHLAKWTVSERDRDGLELRRYEQMPTQHTASERTAA